MVLMNGCLNNKTMDRVEELKKQFILDWMPPFMEEYEPGAFEKDLDKLLQLYADEQRDKKPLASIIIKPNCIKVHGGENEAFEASMKELHKRYILWALGEKPRTFIFEMYIESNQEGE